MKKMLIALISLFGSFAASAENTFMFEPLFGYNFGSTFRLKLPAETQNLRGSGYSMGGKVGYQFDEYQFMFEYVRSEMKTNDTTVKKDIASNEYAFVFGYNYHNRWRPYVGYIFSANARTEVALENDTSAGLHADVGSGYKLGVSYTVSKYVYVNLEYKNLTFDKLEAGAQKVSSDTTASTYMIGISSPLQLWY